MYIIDHVEKITKRHKIVITARPSSRTCEGSPEFNTISQLGDPRKLLTNFRPSQGFIEEGTGKTGSLVAARKNGVRKPYWSNAAPRLPFFFRFNFDYCLQKLTAPSIYELDCTEHIKD